MNAYQSKMVYKVIFFLCFFFLPILGYQIYVKWFERSDLTIVGSVCMADGIGRQSVELIHAFKDEITINFFPTTETHLRDVPNCVKKILKKKQKKLGKMVLFEDCVWVPGHEHFQKIHKKKQNDEIFLAYSMFESTEIPEEWVEIFNTHFDAVIVPDPFHVNVYETCGVKVPIFVLPLGLDLSPYLNQPLKVEKNHPFTFGFFGAGISRKNILKSIQAFEKAFGFRQDVRFLVHCRYALPEIEEEIKDYIEKQGLHNVQFSHKRLSRDEYISLFKEIDCYVNFSKGEGFSIQPREAMALGIPVILTDNTAQHSICESGLVSFIPSNIRKPAERRWGGLLKEPKVYGEEFDCLIDDMYQAFLDMYKQYDTYLTTSAKMRSWVKQYDFSRLHVYYQNLLNPQKIRFGTKNEITPDHLMTNSKELYKKYKSL